MLGYAIGYARNGAHMVPRVAATVETVRPLFESAWPTSAALWLRNGGPQPGGLYANPVLADTYERVVREAEAAGGSRERRIEAARDAWYRGFVAEAIDRFCRTTEALDTSGRRNAGVLTGEDMAGWRAGVEAPLARTYRGRHTVLKCGPWSQGPAMLQTLALLEGFDLGALDPVGPDFVHLVVEAMKLAFADREAFYGDPDFVDVPMAALLSPAYAETRRALIGDRASLEFRPGSPDGRAPPATDYAAAVRRAQEVAMAAGTGEPTVSRARRLGRRHLPRRRHRPLGQHGERHALGGLAAILAGHPGARLLPRLALPDVLAGRGRCPTGSSRASGRAPRFRPPWCCATTAGPG